MERVAERRSIKIIKVRSGFTATDVECSEVIVWDANAWEGHEPFEGIIEGAGDTKEFTPTDFRATHGRWQSFPFHNYCFECNGCTAVYFDFSDIAATDVH